MANNSNSIPTDSTTMGSVLDRPLCRQDNQVVIKLRVLASGSGRYPYGCLHSTMDELDEAFRKSPMESDISGSEQDTSRAASSSVQTTCPKTPHPLLHKNWMLSVWRLSGTNWNPNI
ncbi:hypothetical protein G6F66_014646 [Rhizopus arrhizus]|nr:hypothetical protein G6F66_014646 [Rhizopus arrhizus]